MRLWSIHPKYLDSKGLTALWREALLARKVLKGKTKGYTKHPQLERFKQQPDPVDAINKYLQNVLAEAVERRYRFDKSKLEGSNYADRIEVTKGQIEFEVQHLLAKLEKRDEAKYNSLKIVDGLDVNGIFVVVEGEVESWEHISKP